MIHLVRSLDLDVQRGTHRDDSQPLGPLRIMWLPNRPFPRDFSQFFFEGQETGEDCTAGVRFL